MNIDESDLLKIYDVLKLNAEYHKNRDRMNGVLHMALETRFSPLTSETISAVERMTILLGYDKEKK